MDSLLKTIKDSRNVKDSTVKMYKTNINNISNAITGKDYENDKFLNTDFDKITKYLNSKSNSVKKKLISSIMVVLNPSKSIILDNNKISYEKYKNLLNNENMLVVDKQSLVENDYKIKLLEIIKKALEIRKIGLLLKNSLKFVRVY